jgi:hypothetical protein
MPAMFDRLFAYALSALIALSPSLSEASQNSLLSPTTGTVSGLQLTNNYNNALDSVNTMNSGASAPTNQLSGTPSLGNWWLNTTANPYPAQVYDGADWLAPFYIDGSNHLILNQVGGGTATVASATTTSICSVPQYFITISGTTTITGLGTGCFVGQSKKITFSGSLTLTYNSSSLIIPGAANVATSAGDVADVVYLGSGDWEVTNYQPASGQALINPAIDVGDVVWTFLQSAPSSKYLFGYGQAISRTTYSGLLGSSMYPSVSGITATNGSPTLTGFSDTTQIGAGTVIEASFLSAPAKITSCTSTTCTMNANANASTTASIQLFPYGDGCGIAAPCSSVGSNFNLPDCRDVVLAGRGNMGGTARSDSYALTSTYFGTSPNAIGAFGGAQSETASTSIAQANLPSGVNLSVGNISAAINVSSNNASTTNPQNAYIGCISDSGTCGSGPITAYTTNGPNAQLNGGSVSVSGSVPLGGSGTAATSSAFPTIQPTLTANCMIRVLAMLELRGLPAFNDNDQPAAIEPRRAA